MLVDITYWKTKQIQNLCIPLAELSKDTHVNGVEPQLINKKKKLYLMPFANGQRLAGTLTDDKTMIHVSSIDMTGEKPILFFENVLLPALMNSTGAMEAIVVLSGGAEIIRLQANNGIVNQENICL